MEWTIKLEARTGWGEVQTFEIGKLSRRVAGLATDEVGLLLDEVKVLLAELRRCLIQSQIDEQVTCVRVTPRPGRATGNAGYGGQRRRGSAAGTGPGGGW
jgi:hypothetical protein